jgi:hypothetical protein
VRKTEARQVFETEILPTLDPTDKVAVRGIRVVPVASNRVQILIGEDESTVIDIMEIHGGYVANIDIYTAAQMETLNPPQHTVQVDQHGRLHVYSEEPDA